MSNILDYLDWRGDLDFPPIRLMRVDNLVLSVLSYLDFAGVVPARMRVIRSHWQMRPKP